MTLEREGNKKDTQVNIAATTKERKDIGDLIDNVRQRLIFDINKERMREFKGSNRRALQGAVDETGATDPIRYIKLDNFLKELKDAIVSEAAIAEITMRPNEITNETMDRTLGREYTKSMNAVLNGLDQLIVKRKDKTTSGLLYPSQFQVKAVFDLAAIEGLTSGKSVSDLIRQGVIVPEYGVTKLPKAASARIWEGGKKALMNQAVFVVVEDVTEEGLTNDLQFPIKIEGKGWRQLMNPKQVSIKGTGPSTWSAYRSIKPLKPSTKLDVLQMAVTGAVGMNEGMQAPRPILRPQLMGDLEDPDTGERRAYYGFTIGGYSGARRGAAGIEIAEDVEGLPSV